MPEAFDFFGGIDFSGAREPLSNLWSAVAEERNGRLCVLSIRPHAFRLDLAGYVSHGWRSEIADERARILWGVDFPFGLPLELGQRLGAGTSWESVVAWVADRPADEIRSSAAEAAKSLRRADAGGPLAPLDLRLYKQTVEGIRWLQEVVEEGEVAVEPQAPREGAATTLIEVYPSGSAQELGLPRRRAPSRPAEARARAAALRTYLDFADPDAEALAVTLEDAWDATIACLTAFLCRDDVGQPYRVLDPPYEPVRCEGWIYRPPAALA
ncbi:MAG: DUF429 domain-containing protein [Gemmatimonadota bacterium]